MKRQFKGLFLHFHSVRALPATVFWFRETNPLPAKYSFIEDVASFAPFGD